MRQPRPTLSNSTHLLVAQNDLETSFADMTAAHPIHTLMSPNTAALDNEALRPLGFPHWDHMPASPFVTSSDGIRVELREFGRENAFRIFPLLEL